MKLCRFRVKHLLLAGGYCVNAVISLAFAYSLSYLVDTILISQNKEIFPYWIVGTSLIAAASCLSNIFLAHYLPIKQDLKTSIEISKNALKNLLCLNYKNYSAHDKGYYYNVVTNSAFAYSSIATELYTRWIANIIIVGIVIIVIFFINPTIGWLFVLYIPITAAASVKPSQLSSKYQERGLPTQDRFLNETKQIIESKREINISRTDAYFIDRYDNASKAYLKFVTKFRLYEILSTNIPEAVNGFYCVLILSVAAKFCFKGDMTIGLMLFLYQVLNFVSDPIAEIFNSLIRKKVNRVNFDRIEDLHKYALEPSGFEEMRIGNDLMEATEFELYRDTENENLLFRLEGIKIPRNSFIIIKGANGSGKTMLINYLTGNVAPEFGCGNVQIAKDIQNNAFLTYPTLVVEGSFEDNLLGITPDEQVKNLLGIDFDNKEISTNPINLSYGQIQKLNLLRVLSTESYYLFLDEPLSNLDVETQDNVLSYLKDLKGKKTIIIVMHGDCFDDIADTIYTIDAKRFFISNSRENIYFKR